MFLYLSDLLMKIQILQINEIVAIMRTQTRNNTVGNGLHCNAQIYEVCTDFIDLPLRFGPAIISGLAGTLPGRRVLHLL